MKYMLLIYGAEDCWTEDERVPCTQALPPSHPIDEPHTAPRLRVHISGSCGRCEIFTPLPEQSG